MARAAVFDLHLRVGVEDDLLEHGVETLEERGARLRQISGLSEPQRFGTTGEQPAHRRFEAGHGRAFHVELLKPRDGGRERVGGFESLGAGHTDPFRAGGRLRGDRAQLLAGSLCAAQLHLRLPASVGHAAGTFGHADRRRHDQEDQGERERAGVFRVGLRGCLGERLHASGIGLSH